ncbi:MFS transporter [Amnibacterium soli]|uniref:MFS transporter n=1 Tax=Amnibacterium soli TaxID=1282736 RepID=A0ABP8ZCZ5_9MICO
MTGIERYVIPGVLRLRLGLLAACLFVVATNGFVIAGLLPEVARDLGVTPQTVGGSISAYAVVVAVVAPAASIVLARAPRVAVLTGGIVLVGLGTVLAVTAGSFGPFLLGRVVSGIGGAVLVPAATAAAPSVLPTAFRGRALAIAGLGFTLASAVGSPLGTLLASLGGWRLALGVLAALAILLGAAVALVVRGLPEPPRIGLVARFAPLADGRVVLALIAMVLATASFNIVYIYSSAVTATATGGSGVLLAGLLLVYGLAGIVGTTLAGRLTDRRGSTPVAVGALVGQVVVLLLLAAGAASYLLDLPVFALWGVTAFAVVVPVQARLVAIDPEAAGIVLSWYSTAMYIGIGLAPVVGGAALAAGSSAVPLAGAAAALLGLGVFALGLRLRGRRAAAVA